MLGFLKAVPHEQTRRSLGFSVLDASLWALMFGLAENFIVPFVLLFGASVLEVSLLQGAAQLTTGLGQLTGAVVIQRGGSRKRLGMAMVTIHALSWLLTFFGTVLTGSAWVGIFLYCFGLFFTNMAGPAWMSWMNDLVPTNQRGVFWASRNRIAGVVQFAAIAAAGWVLDGAKQLHWELPAYGVLFGLAFATRLGGVFCLVGQHEPPMQRTEEGRQMTLLQFIKELPGTNFGRFSVFSMGVTFSLVMIYPIIQVYLLQQLHFDYTQYSWVMMAFTIASFFFMTYWGPLSDRFGNRRILLVSAVLLPLMALAWIFVTDWRLLILLQLASGFLVSGVNLTTTNFMFDSVKPERLAKTVAYFTTANMTMGFLGSVAGGVLAQVLGEVHFSWGFLGPLTTVFLVAAVLRVLVLALLAGKFAEVRPIEESPGLRYFYVYKPFQDVVGLLGSLGGSVLKRVKRFRRKSDGNLHS